MMPTHLQGTVYTLVRLRYAKLRRQALRNHLRARHVCWLDVLDGARNMHSSHSQFSGRKLE